MAQYACPACAHSFGLLVQPGGSADEPFGAKRAQRCVSKRFGSKISFFIVHYLALKRDCALVFGCNVRHLASLELIVPIPTRIR